MLTDFETNGTGGIGDGDRISVITSLISEIA